MAWRSGRGVTLSATHQFGRQEGGLAPGSASVLSHNTFVLAVRRRSSRE
jgi:hypothetical protein